MIIFFRLFLVTILYHIFLFAHCQIPCGIYSDAMQIIQIQEDLSTIEKAMGMINSLSEKSDPQSFNQLNRWIVSKEKHAQNIQDIISEYFLTQRIKQSSKNYENELITLHQLLVSVMKCKQNVNEANVRKSNELLDNFLKLYFDEHGINHLKKLKSDS
ncbi:MAG: superoxide dismutase [Candidatus Marinimicrobia bacterium]|nr:superoxide dismutase [Candidatus Neomarinimicrobiota bacterium]|tara:strand:+ start:5057 stop:5530 length:474 start_codon:yes stop_codon:yes gene_type:complete